MRVYLVLDSRNQYEVCDGFSTQEAAEEYARAFAGTMACMSIDVDQPMPGYQPGLQCWVGNGDDDASVTEWWRAKTDTPTVWAKDRIEARQKLDIAERKFCEEKLAELNWREVERG